MDTGQLLKVASFSKLPDGFKKDEFSLFPIKLKVWRGCVFINLMSDASFEENSLFQRNPEPFKNFPIEEMIVSNVWENE